MEFPSGEVDEQVLAAALASLGQGLFSIFLNKDTGGLICSDPGLAQFVHALVFLRARQSPEIDQGLPEILQQLGVALVEGELDPRRTEEAQALMNLLPVDDTSRPPGKKVLLVADVAKDVAETELHRNGFGVEGVLELIALSGYYTLMAMVLNTAGMALPDNAAPPLKPL